MQSSRARARRLALFMLVALVVVAAATPPLLRWWLGPESPLRVSGVEAVEQWMPEIRSAAHEAGLPSPFLLAGLVYAESRGRADAVSSIGALGLCQLLPTTAAELGTRYGVDVEPLSPTDNLRLGARYLAQQLQACEGDVDLALLSYRLGPYRVKRQVKEAGGAESYKALLQSRTPSPWGYREQVLELAEVFARRADEGATSFPSD